MGFAVLHYNNTTNTAPMGHIIHDIVGVVTGTYTSTASLSASANTALCSIYNSASRGNWEFLFPATHGTRSGATNNFILRAPCIASGSKYKNVRIAGVYSTNMASTASDNLKSFANNTNIGVMMTACTAATSISAMSNESYYNTYSSAGSDYLWYTKQMLYGPHFYISWSSRHLLILSQGYNNQPNNTADLCYVGCFEHTETSLTTYRNVAPFCHIQSFSTNYNTSVTTPSAQSSADGTRYSTFHTFNYFNPKTNTTSGINNWWSDHQNFYDDMTMLATGSNTYPTVNTKTSTGAVAMFMQPLFFHQVWNGIPHTFISQLCDVYRVPAGLGNNGDLLTVGADTYVYFTTPQGYGLAVKRA